MSFDGEEWTDSQEGKFCELVSCAFLIPHYQISFSFLELDSSVFIGIGPLLIRRNPRPKQYKYLSASTHLRNKQHGAVGQRVGLITRRSLVRIQLLLGSNAFFSCGAHVEWLG